MPKSRAQGLRSLTDWDLDAVGAEDVLLAVAAGDLLAVVALLLDVLGSGLAVLVGGGCGGEGGHDGDEDG